MAATWLTGVGLAIAMLIGCGKSEEDPRGVASEFIEALRAEDSNRFCPLLTRAAFGAKDAEPLGAAAGARCRKENIFILTG